MQWLQNQSQTNGDNLINVRRETSRIFRDKKRNSLKKLIILKMVETKLSETYKEP